MKHVTKKRQPALDSGTSSGESGELSSSSSSSDGGEIASNDSNRKV